MDLTGLWRGEITPRRAAALALKLPMGSMTWIEVGTDAAWSAETHMIAHVIDQLEIANWQRAGGKGKAPKPIDRPADAKKSQEKRAAAFEKAAKFSARQRAKPAAPSTPANVRPRDERGRFVSLKG